MSQTHPSDTMDRRIARPKVKRWRLPLIVASAVALAGAIAAAMWLVPAADALTVDAADVEIAQARLSAFENYLPVRAEVAPSQTVYVTALEGGQVREVLARDGQLVQPGQPLAELTSPQLQLEAVSQEAQIASRLGDITAQELALQRANADGDMRIAEANYNLLRSQRDFERRQRLLAAGIESPVGVKPFQDEVTYNKNRLAALTEQKFKEAKGANAQRAYLQQISARLQGNLALVHASLGALTIKAPVAGRLTNFDLQPGKALARGEGVGQVDSEGLYKLVAQIDEFYLGQVSPGDKATAQLGTTTLALSVIRVLPQVTNGRFRVELGFAGTAPEGLRRGQSVDVKLSLGETRRALVLPNKGWVDGSGGAYVFVVSPGGHRAERREIRTGRRNPNDVEILSGLRPGEHALVSSYSGFEPYKHILLR